MFSEIAKTLLSIIVIFFWLILAFALSFYALMLDNTAFFDEWSLSLIHTFVMMVGELNYQDNILKPYLKGSLSFPELTFIVFIWFVLLVPILLMNLLIGLAVGDIAEVQSNAVLKQIAMQIDLHTNLEEKLPYWILKRVDHNVVTVYPNSKCKKLTSFLNQEESRKRVNTWSKEALPLEREIRKHKYKLKQMTDVLDKQHHLLKLIVQKMEINTEAEETDGPQLTQTFAQRLRRQPRQPSRSAWDPVIKAITAKDT